MTERVAAPYLHVTPRSAPGVDLRHYPITPQEAFLWGRLDGQLTLAQLADVTGMTADHCLESLDRLAGLGLVVWPDDALPQRAAAGDLSRDKTTSEEAALREPGDLTETERRNILKVEGSLSDLNHWELLGVQPDTPAAGLKKAYHHASKLYHPDRYFGKNLGSFRLRLERIFDAMRKAYDTLADAQTATAYRQQHPPRNQALPAAMSEPVTVPTPPPPPAAHPVAAAELEAHRAAIIAQRKARDLQRLVPSLQGQTSRAESLMEQGERDAAAGRDKEAARSFGAASDIVPAKVAYALKAAHAYSMGGDFTQARVYLERVLSMNPKRKELLLLGADMAEAAGNVEDALHYLGLAGSLDEEDPHVKHWVGRLTRRKR